VPIPSGEGAVQTSSIGNGRNSRFNGSSIIPHRLEGHGADHGRVALLADDHRRGAAPIAQLEERIGQASPRVTAVGERELFAPVGSNPERAEQLGGNDGEDCPRVNDAFNLRLAPRLGGLPLDQPWSAKIFNTKTTKTEEAEDWNVLRVLRALL
jgi:hypothetical protein